MRVGFGKVWVRFGFVVPPPFPGDTLGPGPILRCAPTSTYLSGTRSGGAGRGYRMNRILFRLQGTHDLGPGEKRRNFSKPGVGF